jgi:hypothetical protein
VFVAKFFDSKVPAATAKGQEAADALGAAVAAKVQEYIAAMEKVGWGRAALRCYIMYM